jgi:hypothetical protein
MEYTSKKFCITSTRWIWLRSKTTEFGLDKQQTALKLKTLRRIPLMESRWPVTRCCGDYGKLLQVDAVMEQQF